MNDPEAARAVTQVFIFANQVPAGDFSALLALDAGLEVLGWETDLEEVIRRIAEIRPALVLVAHEVAATDCAAVITRISKECPGIQVVGIDLQTCVLRIYGGESAVVQDVRALVSLIELRAGLAR